MTKEETKEEMIPATVPYAMAVVVNALNEDKSPNSMYEAFKSSIAMCFLDEYVKFMQSTKWHPTYNDIARIGNTAAENFLRNMTQKLPPPIKAAPQTT